MDEVKTNEKTEKEKEQREDYNQEASSSSSSSSALVTVDIHRDGRFPPLSIFLVLASSALLAVWTIRRYGWYAIDSAYALLLIVLYLAYLTTFIGSPEIVGAWVKPK